MYAFSRTSSPIAKAVAQKKRKTTCQFARSPVIPQNTKKEKKEKEKRIQKGKEKKVKTNVRKATSKPGRRKHQVTEGIHKVTEQSPIPAQHTQHTWMNGCGGTKAGGGGGGSGRGGGGDRKRTTPPPLPLFI